MIETNSATIGSFLRTLRKARRLSMVEAARQAGLHRATLDRWEKGDSQPRLAELDSLLAALTASARQKYEAAQRMETPRAMRRVQSQFAQAAEQSGMSSMPHGGELLIALRMRRGVSLEEAARHVGITGGTLRRWEKMEVWPSIAQLHRLCYALGAQEEEIIALTLGQFSRTPRMEKVSLEDVEARLQGLFKMAFRKASEGSPMTDIPLLDLMYLQMEADTWPLALRSAAGKQMLIKLYAHHSHILSADERLTEAGRIASRALELMENKLKPERFWMYPVIVSARARAFGGAHPAPKRALERLRPWASMSQWPEMQAWLMADMAKYLNLNGESEAALTLAEQGCRQAATMEDEVELYLRRGDKARILLSMGRSSEALALAGERNDLEGIVEIRVDVSLLRAEAYLELGNLSEAHDWLQRVGADVAAYRMEHKRPLIERLAERL